MNRPTVAIVDAYSTGRLLAQAWSETHRIVHINSSSSMPEAFARSAPIELFDKDLRATDDFDLLCAAVAREQPVAVVCGSEFGVEYADKLAQALGLVGNPSATSSARRDKHLMAANLARQGVAVASEICCETAAEAVNAYQRLGAGKAVVKPVDSAGSDDVYICSSQEEARLRASAMLGRKNLMQKINQRILVQEFLQGYEYVVNSVSADGRHYVTDVWLCRKTLSDDGRPVYDHEILLAPDDPALGTILPYMHAVLDSLDIRWGPAHSELILTAKGPRLLETGARISGLANPRALDMSTGHNQVSLSKQLYLDPDSIVDLAGRPYQLLQHARCINLIALGDALIDALALERSLAELPSFESLRLRTSNGRVRKTVDLNSSPGVVFLVHSDAAQLARDYLRIRELEHHLYELAAIA